VSLNKQILIGVALLLAIGAGAFWHIHNDPKAVAEAAVRTDPDAVPVDVAQAERGVVRERIEAVGTTLARQAVDIVALTSGRVIEFAISPGQTVEAGEVLVRLDDEAERATVAEADASLREAALGLERARKLRVNNTVPQATVDGLEAAYLGAEARLDGAKKQLADRTVRAPFSGVVGIRQVDVGARVDEDTVLTTLDDLAEVEIQFSVPEIFFGQVRRDQTVSASSSAFPGRDFAGRIAVIDTRVGEVSRECARSCRTRI
jgi:membrane fusion protein (multidrug efflux system)